jgi:hypothetical protein
VNRKVSIVLFWALMAFATIALWRTVREDPRGSLRTVAFVVPLILFFNWFRSRFSGPRRRLAMIMIYSALFAVIAGLVVVFNILLFRSGFQGRSNMWEAVVAGAVVLLCSSVFMWSLCRLVRRDDKVPT